MKKILPLQSLAVPTLPTPPSGSGIDQINITPFNGYGALICGVMDGQYNTCSWGYQEFVNDDTPITGFSFLIKKAGSPTIPLYVGLATNSQINNYPNDPTHWTTFEEIYPSDLPTDQYAWVNITDISVNATNMNLVVITNEPNPSSGTYFLGINEGNHYTPGNSFWRNTMTGGSWTEVSDIDIIFITYSPAASVSAEFASCSDTNLIAAFQWANGIIDPVSGFVVDGYILDPTGNDRAYFTSIEPNGSQILSFMPDMPGIWTAICFVWDGNDYVIGEDYCAALIDTNGTITWHNNWTTKKVGDTLSHIVWEGCWINTTTLLSSQWVFNVYKPDGTLYLTNTNPDERNYEEWECMPVNEYPYYNSIFDTPGNWKFTAEWIALNPNMGQIAYAEQIVNVTSASQHPPNNPDDTMPVSINIT